MGFRDDERGQAIQIGFILIFGVLIISFASYQAFVVPNQNSEVEFNHNQQVQGQFQELRNAIVSSVSQSTTTAVAIALGTTYPSRIVAANPPSPSGTLRTVGTTDRGVNLSINNAVAQNPETADYWNGSQRNFSTGLLEYRPNYNEYNNAPRTVYENTLLYNQFRGANRTVTGQSLVDGNELTLVVLNGSVQAARSGSYTVDVQPVSTPDSATVVKPEPGENLTVSFVSRLPAEQWNETLAGEYNASPDDGRYVTNVTDDLRGDGLYEVTLTFEEDATYRLRMAKVGVGNGVTEESTAYLTDIDGEGTSVQQGENATVTLSTRDQFGNPGTATTVYADSSAGSFADDEKQTDANGRVQFTYDSDGVSPGTQRLNFSLASISGDFDQSTAEDVTVNVTVTRSGGNGNGSAYDVSWLTNNGDDFTLNLAGNSSVTKELDAGASITAEGLNFDYAVNDTNVATVDPGDGVTNSSGENRTTLDATQTGTVAVYVVSGGSRDVVNVTVEDTGGTGGTSGGPPTITTATFSDANNVINDSEANSDAQRTVTLMFNETMDQGVTPAVVYENVSAGGDTYMVNSGRWTSGTTYEQTLTFSDNNVDTPVTVEVSNAQDDEGQTMATERPLQFDVDTRSPGDPNSIRIDTPDINISNENDVTATLVNPSSLDGDETAVLSIVNASTNDSVTVEREITAGGGSDTTFTRIDTSPLPDGFVSARGFVKDDAGNTGGTTTNDQTTKDTQRPTVVTFSNVSVDNGTNEATIGDLDIEDSVSGLSSVNITVRNPSGTLIGSQNFTDLSASATFSRTDLTVSTSGIQPNKDYTITVVLEDVVGNGRAQSKTASDSPGGPS